MTKKLFTAIVALMLAAPTFAQYSSGGFVLNEESLYYGVRIGMTVAGIGGDVSVDSRTGMTLGGVIGLRVSDTTPLFLESGLYYTERGGNNLQGSDYDAHLNYLEIPLLIKYGFKATDQIALLPFIGPYFAVGISGDYDYFKRPEMGFKLGCGAEYNKIYFELGYQFGVSNIAKDKGTIFEKLTGDPSAHGHAFFMNLGINF